MLLNFVASLACNSYVFLQEKTQGGPGKFLWFHGLNNNYCYNLRARARLYKTMKFATLFASRARKHKASVWCLSVCPNSVWRWPMRNNVSQCSQHTSGSWLPIYIYLLGKVTAITLKITNKYDECEIQWTALVVLLNRCIYTNTQTRQWQQSINMYNVYQKIITIRQMVYINILNQLSGRPLVR